MRNFNFLPKTENERYNVLSPDGFAISFDSQYNTIEEAEEAFNNWQERFKMQGYYSSSRYGRIPLAELKEHCALIVQEVYEED